MNGFGERLKKLRKERDVTQTALAVPSAVGKYECLPKAYPSVEALIKIADFFNVSIDYLLKGTPSASAVENNINGSLSNSPFIQANHGGVIFNGDSGKAPSPEAIELLHIYEELGGRKRLMLLNFAVELERSKE